MCAGAFAISIATRFKQSPRGMASGFAAFAEVAGDLRQWKRGCKTYRQTGITDEDLSAGFRAAAKKLALLAPFPSWEACEDQVAKITTQCCHGSKQEAFSARQVAADVFRVKGCVSGGGPLKTPASSRLGPGAKAGWFLAQRAAGVQLQCIRTPKTVPYKLQTLYCERSKLVKRCNFPGLARRAMYVPRKKTNSLTHAVVSMRVSACQEMHACTGTNVDVVRERARLLSDCALFLAATGVRVLCGILAHALVIAGVWL